MKSTFRILFYVNRSKERNGVVPIFGRITVNGTVAQFSCKCSIPEPLWCTEYNCARGKSTVATKVNLVLGGFRSMIFQSYNKFMAKEHAVTARMIKEDIFRTGNDYKTLLGTIDRELKMFRERVGKDRALKTYRKMEVVRRHLKEFILLKYNLSDIYLQDVDKKFVLSFSRYIQFDKGLEQSTNWVYCTFLKKVLVQEYNEGNIRKNPFCGLKLSPNVKEKHFLGEDELQRMICCRMPQEKLQKVKEMFLFCCFTGLSYIDLKLLSWENLKTINGEEWIIGHRHKNRMPYQVKLLKYPLEILRRHAVAPGQGRTLFDIGEYGQLNRMIKQVGILCGIEKRVTFHIARHTFATLAISKGMPIESVSKVLGHSNITTTQIYAKIVNRKLDHDLSQLDKRLENMTNKTSLFSKNNVQIP